MAMNYICLLSHIDQKGEVDSANLHSVAFLEVLSH